MNFSYHWLQDYIKEKLPKPQKLAELLTMHSFEVEGIEKRGRDFVLDVDVLPNRVPDCGGHLGLAREIAAITNLKYTGPTRAIKEEKKNRAEDFIKVEVKDKNACPRYTARVVTGLQVKPSPKWLRERLENCGLQAINNVVDVVNYVMLETGQPLHAFDFEKISGIQDQKPKIKNQKLIIVRRARQGERITTLDDKTYELEKDILVIADSKKPIAIAGIKGGKTTGVDKDTKIVVLEAANFEPRTIRKGSQLLKLRTDASLRFEHGLDPNLTAFAIDRAAGLLKELAKGRVVQGRIDFYPQKVQPRKINLNLEDVGKLLGLKIPLRKIKAILKNLNLQWQETKPLSLRVEVPTVRRDLKIKEDLIEEIGRIWGYEKIPTTFPLAPFVPPERNEKVFWRNFVKNSLKELGFTEVYNYAFLSSKDAEIFGYKISDLIEIENPLSAETKYLRPSLIPNLLKNVKENMSRFQGEEIKIFEIGKVFKSGEGRDSKEKPREIEMLSGLIFQPQSEGEGFYRLKGITESFLEQMGISEVWYDDYQQTPEYSPMTVWHSQRTAEIKIDQQEVGFLGEISQQILAKKEIKGRVFLFELNFEKLSGLATEEEEYRPLSPYPAAVRDIAILVPQKTKVVDVLNVINRAGGKMVRDIDLFDIYEGEELPQGKKNFAFHIIYQAEDHTLSSKEIDKIHNKIVKALEREVTWEVRK